MDCKITEDQLVSYLLQEINEEERLMIENHLIECQYCQKIMDELNELHEAWNNPINVQLPKDFPDEVMANLPKKNSKLYFFQSKKIGSVYNFALTSAATFLFIYFDFLNVLSRAFYSSSPTLIEAKKSLLLVSINGSIWLDKIHFKIVHFFQ